MKELLYVTGNKDKFSEGVLLMKKYRYTCVQQKADIQELQDTDGEAIARHKAEQAYQLFKKPLIINDSTWMIPALNNFPGALMKYTNDCFTAEDWLRLMNGVEDRRVIIREIIVYKDENYEKVFFKDEIGAFLYEPTGIDGQPSDKVVSFTGDDISVAMARDNGTVSTTNNSGMTGYDLLGEWLQSIESPMTRNIA